MQFCDDCGSMMHTAEQSSASHQNSSSSENTHGEEMVCQSCGARVAKDTDRAAEFVSTAEQTDDDVIETEEGADFEGKPTANDVHCDECGHEKAWYTIKQTGSADEPPTRFFKCQDCGHRWREYN